MPKTFEIGFALPIGNNELEVLCNHFAQTQTCLFEHAPVKHQ